MLKMKLSGFLAFTLLSISILSFGLTDAVNAQQSLPISVNTDSSTYTTGSTIEISGLIKTLAEFEQPVVLMIVSPDGNIVTIQQVMPDSDGFYSATVKAGGTMNSSGEFEIRAQYGAEKITGIKGGTSNLAAFISLARVILNLDETVTRE